MMFTFIQFQYLPSLSQFFNRRINVGIQKFRVVTTIKMVGGITSYPQPGEIHKGFLIQKVIATTHNADVFDATRLSDNFPCVVKVIRRMNIEAEHELNVFKSMDSPYIIKPIASFEIRAPSTCPDYVFLPSKRCIVFPKADLSDVHNVLCSLSHREIMSEEFLLKFMFSSISAISHMNERGLMHRDIKPENFVVMHDKPTPADIKLIDMGLVGSIKEPEVIICNIDGEEDNELDAWQACEREVVGTPEYAAPEVQTGHYGPQCDIFSLGATLFVMATKRLPFQAPTASALQAQKMGGAYFDERVWRHYSPLLRETVARMMDPNPEQRITIDELLRSQLFDAI